MKLGFTLFALVLVWSLSGCKKSPPTSTAPEPPPADSTASSQNNSEAPAQYFDRSNSKPADPSNPLFAGLGEAEKAKYEAWFKLHNIDPNNTAALDLDPDSDGYTSREEFLADTNPNDPGSAPGLLSGTIVKEFNEVKIPIILREVKSNQAMIERTDDTTQESIQEGAVLKGLPYKVSKVKHEMKADKHGVLSDVSQVTLENSDTKEKIVLIRDMPARSSESHAVIQSHDETLTLRYDETFTLKSQPGKTFRVIDLRPDQVVVQDEATKEVLTIPKP